ncbi:MAG: caspase family protein [Woeseia sp.]
MAALSPLRRWCVAVVFLFGLAVQAADTALLGGIGKYMLSDANLPGIEYDISVMKQFAISAGFDAKNIIVLSDEQATLSGFRLTFQTKLLPRITVSDRVLIYFSGHGTQVPDLNGDETDNSDEALLMHNTRKRYRQGKLELVNVLIDDEIETMLAAIPAREVLVLVDACHSGTVTRVFEGEELDVDQEYLPKSYVYEGMPESMKRIDRTYVSPASGVDNYVALTAAGDDELAIATKNGSVFTIALGEVVADASSQGEALTFEGLQSRVTSRVWASVRPDRKFTPRISGNIERASQIAVVKGD